MRMHACLAAMESRSPASMPAAMTWPRSWEEVIPVLARRLVRPSCLPTAPRCTPEALERRGRASRKHEIREHDGICSIFLTRPRNCVSRSSTMSSLSKPQHLFGDMLTRVCAAAGAILRSGADLSRIVVEPPRDPSHGDMATNAAMVLAKDAGQKPRQLAENIAEKLRADEKIAKVDVAGPGFINLVLKPHVWGEELRLVLESGMDYGRTMGQGEKVNVEYVSANPT